MLGTTMYEDTFDDSTECVDLFIDWTTVSQLIKYFGNPTVYPIKGCYQRYYVHSCEMIIFILNVYVSYLDYQPVIKLPVSLARHLHAHLIESVIDQAEKNENLMDQLNFGTYFIFFFLFLFFLIGNCLTYYCLSIEKCQPNDTN